MLYAGKQITSPTDQLTKVTTDYLYHSIRNPKSDIESQIRQLRIIKNIDSKKYALLKRQLPYLVCGTFNPPFRRTENFAFIDCFIVDIDHITAKGLSIAEVRNQLQSDARAVLCFLSPGEDGLKVLFNLKERCYDHGIYTLFYKIFVQKLSEQYQLEQVIDEHTSDVCRACFISCDPNAYYNASAEPVDIKSFLDESNPSALFDLKKYVEKKASEQEKPEGNTEDVPTGPDDEAISNIKKILKMKPLKANKTAAFVPEELENIIADLQLYIENTGLQVSDIININYGKKLRMKLALKQAEVNVFYGKRGFSVVESPRTGTNEELNKLASELIKGFLYQFQ
jgi:hypothetical protein